MRDMRNGNAHWERRAETDAVSLRDMWNGNVHWERGAETDAVSLRDMWNAAAESNGQADMLSGCLPGKIGFPSMRESYSLVATGGYVSKPPM